MVNFIQAGGEKRPFLFSYKALKLLTELLGVTLSDFELDLKSFQNIEKAMFAGFVGGYKVEKKEVDFKLEDMEEWIENDFELIEICSNLVATGVTDLTSKKNPTTTNQQPTTKKK